MHEVRMMSGKLLTAQELAEKLSLSVETIWRYTRQKQIPYVEVGRRQYRYNLEAVLKAMQARTRQVAEEAAEYLTDPLVTYQDYLKMPEKPGVRYEVIQGRLIEEPSPSVLHQRVSYRLQMLLINYFNSADPEGEVLSAPLDVELSDITVVQPDLLYIPGSAKAALEEVRILIPPKLVVEIVSPITGRKDRLEKMQIYRDAGVEHYWLVDLEGRFIEAYALEDNGYVRVAESAEVFTHPDFPGLEIDIADIFPR